MAKLHLLFLCAVLAFIELSTGVDAAAVAVFDQGTEQIQPDAVKDEERLLPGELEDIIYDPRDDSVEDLIPDDSEENLVPDDSEEDLVPEDSEEDFVPADSEEDLVPEDSEEDLVPDDSEENLVPDHSEEDLVPEDSEEDLVPDDSEEDFVPADSEEDLVPNDSDAEGTEKDNTQFLPTELTAKQGLLTKWYHHIHWHHDDDYHYHYDDHHDHDYHYHYDYDHHHHHDEGVCKCSGDTCDCCASNHDFHVTVDGRDIVLSACVNVTYLNCADKYDVSVNYNNIDVVTKRELDLDHAPKLCYPVPGFKDVTSCVEFRDVSHKHACVKLSGKLNLHKWIHTSITLYLGCFTIPGN